MAATRKTDEERHAEAAVLLADAVNVIRKAKRARPAGEAKWLDASLNMIAADLEELMARQRDKAGAAGLRAHRERMMDDWAESLGRR